MQNLTRFMNFQGTFQTKIINFVIYLKQFLLAVLKLKVCSNVSLANCNDTKILIKNIDELRSE